MSGWVGRQAGWQKYDQAKQRGSTYLGGADDGLADHVGARDHHLLREHDALRRDLHAEVAARHHDAVAGGQDLVVVVQALRVRVRVRVRISS
jgi:hypothetical protein